MEITVSSEQGRVPVKVFHIKGDIDTETHDQLQTAARQAIDEGTRYLVLDLTDVPYVSSWGIRAISQIFTWLRQAAQDEDADSISKGVRDGTYHSHHLKVACPTPRVFRVLTETGLDMYVQIEDDVKKAVDSF